MATRATPTRSPSRPCLEVTRACVYDRAGLGRSDPPPGPRGLRELVRDLERLLRAAAVPAPYVLVGTSGGGYITAGYAAAHPREVGGLVFVDTFSPFRDPPRAIVEETAPAIRRTRSGATTSRSSATRGPPAGGSVTSQ